MTRRLSVVLLNLGGPDSPAAVRPFLFNLFNDRAIIGVPQPFRWVLAQLVSRLREQTAKNIYAQMGGASPLGRETEAQRLALSAALSAITPGDMVQVVIAMRYWRPFTVDAAKMVEAFKPDDVVLLPLYPQYSTTTTGSSRQAWADAYRGSGQIHAVCCYPTNSGFIEAHVRAIRKILTEHSLNSLRLVFSAHGLPEKVIKGGDPYQSQIERTAKSVADQLGARDWIVSYQSRVGPMKWLGPSTLEIIDQAGRESKGVIIVPIAFVSEHSETLVELDRDYRDHAKNAGVPVYLRVPAIGIDPRYINALAEMVIAAAAGDEVSSQSTRCGSEHRECPLQRCAKAA
jgi:ferrochelatase